MNGRLRLPHIALIISTLFLCIIPFFWLKPGEMDLGGDSSRLYFYDPLAYIKNFSFYGVLPEGIGLVSPNYYFLPFLFLLVIAKFFLRSSYLLIVVFDSLKLVVGFLALYAIVKEFAHEKVKNKNFVLRSEFAALLAGGFYTFASSMTGNWDKALLSQNQVFLNPLMFFLLMRFFLTRNYLYALGFLFISFVFSPNFAFTSAPAVFAFYPLSLLFLMFYITIIRKKKLPWRGITFIGILFIGLQAFHLIPQLINLFDSGSYANTRVFDKQSIVQEGIRYFIGVLPLAKVSNVILLPSPLKAFLWESFLVPGIVLMGFFLNKEKKRSFLLTSIFFLITLFLLSAHITNVGVAFYKSLFYIPGFSMFRNFIGQWTFVYTFFYALLFGQAVLILFQKVSRQCVTGISSIIAVALITSAWSFINGQLVNKQLLISPPKYIAITMDKNFENALQYVKKLPDDSKVLTLPLTDSFYQIVQGANNGMYVGPSLISYIGGKKDFSGYQILAPFNENFLQLAKEKDYKNLAVLLGLLNIRYVFYNANTQIYDNVIPDSYFQYVRQSLPKNQFEYKTFIEAIGSREIFRSGDYHIYEINNSFLSHFYVPEQIVSYTKKTAPFASFFVTSRDQKNAVYIDTDTCNGSLRVLCRNEMSRNTKITVFSKKSNPAKYHITLQNVQNPFILVFSEAFHKNWKIEAHADTIGENRHILVNGYANAWYITPKDLHNKQDITLTVEMAGEKMFYISSVISLISLLYCIIWGVKLVFIERTT